jgi:hypothetical protein
MAIRCTSKPVIMREERGICKSKRLARQNFAERSTRGRGENQLDKPNEGGTRQEAS